MTAVLRLAIALLPASRLKNRLLNAAGHRVASSAHVSPVLVMGKTQLVIGEHAHLGNFNAIRNVPSFFMGERCVVGQFNWFSASTDLIEHSPHPTAGCFTLRDCADVTSRHLFDVSGGITVGSYSVIGGVRSTFISHGLDVEANIVRTAPITIGEHTMVGSNTKVIFGSHIPSYCAIAMGSVVTNGLRAQRTIYGGVPARAIREIEDADYWKPENHHTAGFE